MTRVKIEVEDEPDPNEYARWLDERLAAGQDEQHCMGTMWGVLHQYVGRPHLHHSPGRADSCPVCAVERKHGVRS